MTSLLLRLAISPPLALFLSSTPHSAAACACLLQRAPALVPLLYKPIERIWESGVIALPIWCKHPETGAFTTQVRLTFSSHLTLLPPITLRLLTSLFDYPHMVTNRYPHLNLRHPSIKQTLPHPPLSCPSLRTPRHLPHRTELIILDISLQISPSYIENAQYVNGTRQLSADEIEVCA